MPSTGESTSQSEARRRILCFFTLLGSQGSVLIFCTFSHLKTVSKANKFSSKSWLNCIMQWLVFRKEVCFTGTALNCSSIVPPRNWLGLKSGLGQISDLSALGFQTCKLKTLLSRAPWRLGETSLSRAVYNVWAGISTECLTQYFSCPV